MSLGGTLISQLALIFNTAQSLAPNTWDIWLHFSTVDRCGDASFFYSQFASIFTNSYFNAEMAKLDCHTFK